MKTSPFDMWLFESLLPQRSDKMFPAQQALGPWVLAVVRSPDVHHARSWHCGSLHSTTERASTEYPMRNISQAARFGAQ